MYKELQKLWIKKKKSEKESKPCGVEMGLENCDYGSSCDCFCRQSRDCSDEKRNKETFKEPQVIRTMGMSTINTQAIRIDHPHSFYIFKPPRLRAGR